MFLPYAKQSIQEEDRLAVAEALKGEVITRGALVKQFEETVAVYCGARYAVAFNSGTSALMAAYFAIHLQSADRVISTPNTFIATIGTPLRLGASLSFADIDRHTGNLDLGQLDSLLATPHTRGRYCLVPTHFAGIAVDMQALERCIQSPDVVVIEDAAHAIGSVYPSGEKVGSCAYSQLTIFSFHPAKTLTTGEGGMVTTNDEALYHRLLLYRDNGIERDEPYLNRSPAPGYYEVQAITGNFHLTSFQAALGLSQFNRLGDFIAKRRLLVKHYRKLLKDIPHLHLFTDRFDEQTAFHLLVVQIDFEAYQTTRERVMKALHAKGIGTQVHYIPLYHHPVFARQGKEWATLLPETEAYYAQALSLPLYFDLTERDVERVCDTLKAILNQNSH